MNCPRCSAPVEEQTLREFGGVCPKCLLAFSEEQDAPAFPNLEIVEMIGQGGMGVVYKARQKNLDRIVALKVLSPQLSEDPEFVERFTREAKALAQLSHPNIVAIHDSGIHDRVPYLVMEYVDGDPLRSLLASGKLTPARGLEFIPQICDALQYAHAHGVVHRDIKPENILVDRQGRIKIADFGLAKLSVETTGITQSGYVMGTPRYMAPEQFLPSGKVDHRADIYSLGVVFYEMLTGEVPMGKFKPPSEKAGVDRRLDPVVLKSLEREPEDRYQSAGEVKDEVDGLKGRPLPATPVPVPSGFHPLRKAALILFCLAVVALGLGLFMGLNDVEMPAKISVIVGLALPLAALVLFILSFFVGPRRPAGSSAPAVAGGCLVFLIAGLGLLVLLALLFVAGGAKSAASPPVAAVTTPPYRPATNGWGEQHWVLENFELDKVWPAAADFPAGSDPGTQYEGKNALQRAGLPEVMAPDLKAIRSISLGDGRVVLVGFQFTNDVVRRQWMRDRAVSAALSSWNCRLDGDSISGIVLRHDGSNRGVAIAETVWPVIKARWSKLR